MDAKRLQPSSHSPWDELSPVLRNAVKRIGQSRAPQDVALRMEERLRSRLARTPQSRRPRFTAWTLSMICTSVALIVCCWSVEIVSARFIQFPYSSDQSGASITDSSHSVWAYSQAARQSPESLNDLLDRQWRESGSARLRPIADSGITSSQTVRTAAP
jgi:hypothetical protein